MKLELVLAGIADICAMKLELVLAGTAEFCVIERELNGLMFYENSGLHFHPATCRIKKR
jgi:hypothetical protein